MSSVVPARVREIITQVIPRSEWWGWGDHAQTHEPAPEVLDALADFLGTPVSHDRTHEPVRLANVQLPESGLTAADTAALTAVLQDGTFASDAEARVRHAGGKSYPDIYRLFHGNGELAPDAVATPASEDELAQLLAVCSERGIAVVPFGGGTSVVGGVNGVRGKHHAVIALDLCLFNRVRSIDEQSLIVEIEAGLRGPEFERLLQERGLTLGHYPQSHQEATLGGYVATRSAGQASTGYGRIDDNVIGLTMVTPTGTLELDGRAPASATGPGLRDFIVGSEGAFGIITRAKLRAAHIPSRKHYAAVAFPNENAAIAALRQMSQQLGHGNLPDVCRWSDAEETLGTVAQLGETGKKLEKYFAIRGLQEPSILLMVWEGQESAEIALRVRRAKRIVRTHGAKWLPSLIAKKWEEGRFRGPYLRDHLMARGVLADTLETATTWDNLQNLHRAVGNAIRGALAELDRKCLVMAHISHVYEAGASLYYTFVAHETDDPLAQWQAVKDAASRAIESAGGTISHHHSVGSDHLPYLAEEVGETGLRVFRAVKRELDPAGILNPGKLFAGE